MTLVNGGSGRGIDVRKPVVVAVYEVITGDARQEQV